MDTPSSVLAEAGTSLALAMIASSNAPVLLLDDQLMVIAASDSFCDTFEIDPATCRDGRPLAAARRRRMERAPACLAAPAPRPGPADDRRSYEMDLVRPGTVSRCLIINARKLDYFDADNVRLVVSAVDVSAARISDKLKDDLLREKAILLQELQHRVANSLQIIASVLMQGARKVRSEQARGHLRDARNRVMSIATMQRQLAASRLGDVVLRDYFTELCASIGASMISDHDQLTLTATVDGSLAKARHFGKPRPDRDRAGDQCPEACFPAPPEGRNPGRLQVDRHCLDLVGARHGRRHAEGSCRPQGPASAPASSRRLRSSRAPRC